MVKKKSPKIPRFVLYVTTRTEYKEDVLENFEERYQKVAAKFGQHYAYFDAWQQAVRSVPFGVVSMGIKMAGWIIKISN